MTQEEAIKIALDRAANDADFKNRLMANPVGTLQAEFPGVEFSNNISLDFELSDDDLDLVSGGMDKMTYDTEVSTTTSTSPTATSTSTTSGKGKGKGSGSGSGSSGSSGSSKSSGSSHSHGS